MNISDVGIIIQARTGSTRMPNKMVQDFYNGMSVLDILILRFKSFGLLDSLILATTVNPNDDIIVNIGKSHDVRVFRGGEDDVLDRFIKCAEHFNVHNIFRVCADNPFFDVEGSLSLIRIASEYDEYTSYKLDGDIPSIRTHLGFWGEHTNLNALKKVQELTKDSFYHEHVTNYIYSHTDDFKCNLIVAPEKLFRRHDIRLTMDSLQDFNLNQLIYKQVVGDTNHLNVDDLISFIDSNDYVLSEMKMQIDRYKK